MTSPVPTHGVNKRRFRMKRSAAVESPVRGSRGSGRCFARAMALGAPGDDRDGVVWGHYAALPALAG